MALAAGIAFVAGVGAASNTKSKNKKIRRTERRQVVKDRQITAIARQRERQRVLAEARKARAALNADAVASGISTSSTAVTQAAGSITSQLNSSASFAQQLAEAENQRIQAQSDINEFKSSIATGQALAGLTSQVAVATAGQ